MPGLTALIIVIAVVAIILVAVGIYYLMRFLRGSIKLELPQTRFQPGEQITGRFELTTKKAIEGKRLLVSLIAKEVIDQNDSNGNRNERKREVYRDQFLIEEDQVYPAGTQKTYEFTIHAPHDPGSHTSEANPVIDAAMVEKISTAVQMAGNLFGSGMIHRLEWQIEAGLDANGVDLAKHQRI